MATPSKAPASKTGPKVDEESQGVIFQGATVNQLCEIFKMDSRDLKAKINGQVKPVGERRGFPVYEIRAVAPYLVAPPYDIDEFIQRMTIADLPSIIRKEFWAGMRSRQLFEKEQAELWPTADVLDMVTTLFKGLRMSLLLTRENVERETELTDKQRAIVTRIIDTALEEAHATTVSIFTQAKSKPKSAELHVEEAADSEDL